MTAEKNSVSIEMFLPVPAEEVWKAWTEPDLLLQWIGSDPQGRGVEASLDVQPGGPFSFSFQNGDGAPHTAMGVYVIVLRPHRLAFSWSWASERGHESFVDLALLDSDCAEAQTGDCGTRMVFRHEHLDPASAHDYLAGWTSTFSKLERTLKGRLLLQRFNDTIGQWICFLDDYTLEMLRQPPRAGSWSLGQVYRHIIDDTRSFARQMRESLDNPADGEKEMHEDARTMLRNNAFPDRMIQGPATNILILQPQDKGQLIQELLSIRDEVNKLFSSSNIAGATGKTPHPGLNYFNTLEWLQFAEMHMRHHFRQKKRIDEQLFISRS